MTDVFISYKRRLRPQVEQIATALRALKVDVWFDAAIGTGKSFSAEINREVARAKCVLVCWSSDAFASDDGEVSWVEAEADIGRTRRVLVPVMIETAALHAPWNMLHTESLVAWLENPETAERGPWQNMLEAVGRYVDRPGLAAYDRAISAETSKALRDWIGGNPADPLFDTAAASLMRIEIDEQAERLAAAAPTADAAERAERERAVREEGERFTSEVIARETAAREDREIEDAKRAAAQEQAAKEKDERDRLSRRQAESERIAKAAQLKDKQARAARDEVARKAASSARKPVGSNATAKPYPSALTLALATLIPALCEALWPFLGNSFFGVASNLILVALLSAAVIAPLCFVLVWAKTISTQAGITLLLTGATLATIGRSLLETYALTQNNFNFIILASSFVAQSVMLFMLAIFGALPVTRAFWFRITAAGIATASITAFIGFVGERVGPGMGYYWYAAAWMAGFGLSLIVLINGVQKPGR